MSTRTTALLADRHRAEDSVPLNQAAQYLPGNVRPSYSTWWRWWRRGIRGVRLRTWLVGGQRHTSAAAIAEWIEQVTAAGAGTPITPTVVPRVTTGEPLEPVVAV